MKKHKFLVKASLALGVALSSMSLSAHAQGYDPNEDYKNLDISFYNDEKPAEGFYINAAANYILETVTNPKVGSTYGEWSVMDLARAGYTGFDYIDKWNNSTFTTTYLNNLYSYIETKNGILDKNRSTEYSRVTLALSALNQAANPVGQTGLNIVDTLNQSYNFSKKQGINGPIWELIALNTKNYEFSDQTGAGDLNTKGKMLDYILNAEQASGGWALLGSVADPDITGMALQALAPYYNHMSAYEATGATVDYTVFVQKVERAVVALAEMQSDNNGFNAFGNANAESTAQVIVALTALGIDPTDKALHLPTINVDVPFNDGDGTQDGVKTEDAIDVLLTFFADGSGDAPNSSGFRHVTSGYDGGGGSGSGVNAMATDQALYGLIAYDRYKKGENALYDMTDAKEKYTSKTYTITYVAKDGTTTTASYAPYAAVDLLDTAETWKTAQGVTYAATETLAMPEQNITLYAQ
jgi:hypothetical protein